MARVDKLEDKKGMVTETKEVIFADKEFYYYNVTNKHCFATEKLVLREKHKRLFNSKLYGVRYKKDPEYVPLYALRIALDGDVPFEVFGSENTEKFRQFSLLCGGTHNISEFMYKFISKCIDKEMYGMLFLINEGDLEVKTSSVLRSRLLGRFDLYVESATSLQPISIKPYTEYLGQYSAFETKSEHFVNAWRYNSSEEILSNLLMHCNMNMDKNLMNYCAFIRASDIPALRASIYACQPIPEGLIFLVIGTQCTEETCKSVTEFARRHGITVYNQTELSEKDRFIPFEKKTSPRFSNPEEMQKWFDTFTTEFILEQKKALGLPLPKQVFVTEEGVAL